MLHLAHCIDSLHIGGAEKLLVTFAAAAQQHEIQLTVISLEQDDDTPIPGQLQALDARVMSFPARKLLSPQRFYHLAKFCQQERFHVIHTHLTYANILGTLVGQLLRIPTVSTLHTTDLRQGYRNTILNSMESALLRHGAHQLYAVGHRVADAHRDRLGRKLHVVPNAIQPTPTLSSRERIALRTSMTVSPTCPLILSVGRLIEAKGFPDLIEAVAMLRRHMPHFMLAIAGEGEYQEPLSRQVSQLNLDSHVRLLGARNDIPQLLAASDLYVNASHWEGLPLSILEAMDAALPVVATHVGDIPQVVVEGTGLLVPPKRPDELAAAIQTLLHDHQRRQDYAVAAQTHVRTHYDAGTWVETLLSLYLQLSPSSTKPTSLTEEVSL